MSFTIGSVTLNRVQGMPKAWQPVLAIRTRAGSKRPVVQLVRWEGQSFTITASSSIADDTAAAALYNNLIAHIGLEQEVDFDNGLSFNRLMLVDVGQPTIRVGNDCSNTILAIFPLTFIAMAEDQNSDATEQVSDGSGS